MYLYLQFVVASVMIEDIQADHLPTESSDYQNLEETLRSMQKTVVQKMIAAQGLHNYYPDVIIDPETYSIIYKAKLCALEEIAEQLVEDNMKLQLDLFKYQSDIPEAAMEL